VAPSAKHRVFISYSSRDKGIADAVCEALESQGIRCWIAPRDIPGGARWNVGVLEAIQVAQAVVLVLTANSNASGMVWRELERAASNDVPIIPFRVEDVQPSKDLQFFLSGHQWLDAFAQPLDQYLGTLLQSVRQLTGRRSRTKGANVSPYLISRGPAAHRDYTGHPQGPWDPAITGTETIENLRLKLTRGGVELEKPLPIKVQGTLYPCALLSSGWWERRAAAKTRQIKWRDGLQEWLFHGFEEWGPSWDFTWDFDNWAHSSKRPYFIAQLGDGDEANSIPVLLPATKAKRLQEVFERTWGGMEAEISGVLGHRKHFAQYVNPQALELFGGLLDYCLWLDDDNKEHKISPRTKHTDVYSGYLWKCVAPKELLHGRTPCLNDVYFIWEHVNFADRDALAYCLEALNNKEEHVRKRYGELMLVQKSSALVPGTPALAADTIYGLLLGKAGEDI
jgi:TIR domain